VRAPQTCEIELRIKHHAVAEIGPEQAAVFGLENVERQGVPALFNGVDDFFELREHRLTEERAAQIVDLPVDNVSAHLSIARGLEKMMREKLFVESGGDFGEENRVIVILKRLRSLREPGVHRMPGLMRESINIGEDVALVIHQDVR